MSNKNWVSWPELKEAIITRSLSIQYTTFMGIRYDIFAEDDKIEYWTEVWINTNYVQGIDVELNNQYKTDFETNYKAGANKTILQRDIEGKIYVRSESRPVDATTYFTTCGDNGNIGNGKRFAWDFSNTDDDITAPSGYKRKRIEFHFIDTFYMKEGTVYYFNKLKGSYFDQYVICPAGYYYYKNDGTPGYAAVDTIVSHYVIKHPMQGDVPMGDELNSETCSSGIPSYYKFWIEVTVPDTDITSNGVIEVEAYRDRTVIL